MKKHQGIFAREILITVFLIILLSILCVKKIKDLKNLAQNSISQRSEQILQEALAVYRGDNEGLCPVHLEALKGEYVENLPFNYANGVASNEVKEGSNFDELFDGKGGWIYINDIKDKRSCEVFANIKK